MTFIGEKARMSRISLRKLHDDKFCFNHEALADVEVAMKGNAARRIKVSKKISFSNMKEFLTAVRKLHGMWRKPQFRKLK